MISNCKLFPPNLKNPYYISSPPYTRTSAGVRALHLLARGLRQRGMSAYIAGPSTNPLFETEILTEALVQAHFDHGLTPIMIYPEVVWGNPHDAPLVVRYLLNYPGALGGPTEFASSDLLIAFGAGIGSETGRDVDNLYIPVCDPTIYFPPPKGSPRLGCCFYAGKFKEVYRQKTYSLTEGMVEITRSGPNVMSPTEIATLFRKSEFFYCYENSSLALEARLCGCPVVLVPSPFFTKVIASAEVGLEGLAWGDSPEQKKYAKDTVDQVLQKYQAGEEVFWKNLDTFIDKTQRLAGQQHYHTKIRFNTSEVGMGELEVYRNRTSFFKRFGVSVIFLIRKLGLFGFAYQFFGCLGSRSKIKALLRAGEVFYISRTRHKMRTSP